MVGVKRDIDFNEGDTFTFILNFKDSDGAVIDKTGKTYDFEIKETANSASTLVSSTGISPSDAANGEVTITIAKTTMSDLSEGRFVYAIKEIDGATTYTKLYGDFVVENTP